MADLQQLETALRNADAAGDTDAARVLAAELSKARQAPVWSGSVLPISQDASGKVGFDSNAGLLGSVKRAFTLPGDVYSGKVQLTTPTISDDPERPDFAGNASPAGTVYNPQALARTVEMGTVFSPTNPMVRSGDRAIPGVAMATKPVKPTVPTAEALKSASEQGYSAAREMGVEIKPQAVVEFGRGLQADLEKDGIFAELAPKTFKILEKLQSPPEGAVSASIANLDAARRALGHAAGDFTNKTEQMAASRAIERLDGVLSRLPETDVVAGPAAAASRTIEKARGNYAAAMRSDRVTGAVENAELNAAVANSGQNVDNAIRQRIKSLLVSPKASRGFSEEELAKAESVARGGAVANAARFTGNLLGGGGGLGAAVTGGMGATAGIATGSPTIAAVGAGAPVLGYGLKKVANALTERQAGKLDEMVRMRSPLYKDMLDNPAMAAISPERRAAFIKALMLMDQQQRQ